MFKDDEDVRNDKHFVRDGYSIEIDELQKMAFEADTILLEYQARIQELTEVSCKLKFVRNQ